MRERPLGTSGPVVSVVGLGCNNFGWRVDEAQTKAVVDAAIDAGITLFDTAESYGHGLSEEFLGRAIGDRRDRVVIATKFGWGTGRDDHSVPRGDPEYVRSAIDESLRKLGTDHVDLYQYHRPDGVTPIAETLGAMDELVRAGQGALHRALELLGGAGRRGRRGGGRARADALRVVAERVLVDASRAGARPDPGARAARDRAAAVLPAGARPAHGEVPARRAGAGGHAARRAGHDVDDATWDRVEAIEAFARERGVGVLDVAIGGLAAQPTVGSVIAGATTPEQVRANAAAGEWVPSADELAALRAL